ncbi:restriction endonuclease subunit S [Avibacterium paragallinarum]|uniref:restriction endonuclease subunit S n=1 Tax=Avibacterium paragallinarum TaxID=728 RepID=UPI0021F7AE39|nr:restriction endonuclease subunit S [Avibacterium paragallinarum]UXN36724.1 restriction endonuclease subunit S [Avibacterium paragallinarum]
MAEIVRGASPRPIQDPKWFDPNSEIGWLRISDVTEQNGRIHFLEQKISKLGQEKTRVLLTPHLLLSIAATVGKPVINYVKTGVHDGFLIFLNPKFDQEFMFQWLEGFRDNWQKYGQPGSQVNLNSDLVKSQEIHLPTLPEQQKIGTLFRRLDRLITLHKRKWDDVILLKKALLQKMFPENDERLPEIRFPEFSGDWEKCKLGDLGTIEMNKRIFKEQTSTIGEIPFYKIGTFGGKADAFISKELFEEYKSKYPYPNKGDLLISASGSVGKVVEYSGKDEYFQDSNIVWFNHNGKLNNLFLKQFYSHVQWEGLEGSTIKRLYNKTILGTQISFPSLPEQQKIGTFFRRLDRLISHHQQQYEHYQLLKKALLQQMFI